MNKPKTNYTSEPGKVADKDKFYSPRYAYKLLFPFIPASVRTVWECACGENSQIERDRGSRRMLHVLSEKYDTFGTDIAELDFLNAWQERPFDAMITNVPFSRKKEFCYRALQYGKPWAFLLPFDLSAWLDDLIDDFDVRFVIPRTRINYLTPNLLQNIHDGELLAWGNKITLKTIGRKYESKAKVPPDMWASWEDATDGNLHSYAAIDYAPPRLLAKYSAAQMTTAWACWGFDLPKQLNFVKLTPEMRLDI